MTRTDRYWAAIARDHAQGEVDAVTRLVDEEIAVVQARLDDAEARVDALTDEVDKWKTATLEFEAAYVTTMDTLTKRSAAHDRLCATVDRVRALVDEWGAEPYPTSGDAGWNNGTDMQREASIDALRTALDEVTP